MISIHAPLAGCDLRQTTSMMRQFYFNPRTPCGVRPYRELLKSAGISISIHAPLAGCDDRTRRHKDKEAISIHAPLAGCDLRDLPEMWKASYFNPRTPCGVRQRGETGHAGTDKISIHAPLAGCDKSGRCWTLGKSNFNPRTPCGVRHGGEAVKAQANKFQSTHPLRGATFCSVRVYCGLHISIHAPLAGCDRCMEQIDRA